MGDHQTGVTSMKRVALGLLAMVVMATPWETVTRSWAACKGVEQESTLSLSDAVRLAKEHNPQLKAAFASREEATQGVRRARSLFLPRVDVETSYGTTNMPVAVFGDKLNQRVFSREDFRIEGLNHPEPRTNMRSALVVTQPIFNGGKELYGLESARYRKAISEATRDQVLQSVILEVHKVYFHWLLAIEKRKVLAESLRTADANLSRVRKLFLHGKRLKSDLLQAEVYRASVRQEVTAAEGEVAIAQSRLNMAMGMAPDQPWKPVFPRLDSLGPSADLGDPSLWQEKALVHRPELKVSQWRCRWASWDVKRAQLNFLPSVNLKGIYERNADGVEGPSGTAYSVMGLLSWNVFRGTGDVADLGMAQARSHRVQADGVRIRQRVLQQVEEAYLRLKTIRSQVKVARRAVIQAKEGLRIVTRRYQEGLTIITELLAAETMVKQVRLNLLKALYGEKIAQARLFWAAGLLREARMDGDCGGWSGAESLRKGREASR